MTRPRGWGERSMSEASEDLFEMATLYPATTELPMTVWVSPCGVARHDVRIGVNMTHGNRMTIANTAIVAVGPVPRVVTGQLLSTDEQTVFSWVTLNEDALVAYWEGRVDAAGLMQRLRRVWTVQGS